MFLLYSIFIYFCNGYKFLTENDLKANEGIVQHGFGKSGKLVLFLSDGILLNICTSDPPLRQAPKTLQNKN